jgi:hypothetical protein
LLQRNEVAEGRWGSLGRSPKPLVPQHCRHFMPSCPGQSMRRIGCAQWAIEIEFAALSIEEYISCEIAQHHIKD